MSDDGKGFDKTKPENGNGLHNMQERAKAMKAQLNIETAEGKGAKINLKMPIT